jgi:hypothetical protein
MPRYPGLSSAHHGLSSRVYTSLLALAEARAPEVFPAPPSALERALGALQKALGA